jgi:hypothetical protein
MGDGSYYGWPPMTQASPLVRLNGPGAVRVRDDRETSPCRACEGQE